MTTPGGRPMSAADIIAMGPMGGAAPAQDDLPKPIGIPKTFQPYVQERPRQSGPMSADQAERRGALGGQTREPYYDGSEMAPSLLSPERRAALQTRLAQAGLIGKNDVYRLGVWDETSRKAYRQVLEHANYRGIDHDTALQELLAAPAFNGQGESVGGGGALRPDPGRVTAKTSGLSLEAQVQQAAQQRLGRKLRPNEAKKFVALYQGMESSYSNKVNSLQDQAAETGKDFTVEEAPSADVAADQFIDSNQALAQEAAGQDAYGYLGALRDLIGG